jgi:hypothetical protein
MGSNTWGDRGGGRGPERDMTVSAINFSAQRDPSGSRADPITSRRVHLRALARALQSKDVEAAKDSFGALLRANERGHAGSGRSEPGYQGNPELRGIDLALLSGDVARAEQLFAVLMRGLASRSVDAEQTAPSHRRVVDIQV